MLLKNERLLIEIGQYEGARFDRTGFISQVTLDGKYTFCTTQNYGDQSNYLGKGLCNEFGLNYAINYDSTAVDEWFIKPGVGLLKKEKDEEYISWNFYEVEPLVFIEEAGEDYIKFVAKDLKCMNYGISYTKIIKIIDNKLTIDYKLRNIGNERICINEYCHNFISINETKIGADYSVKLPIAVTYQSENDELSINGNLATWKKECSRQFYYGISASDESLGKLWTISHNKLGVSISERVSCDVIRFALWGKEHVISPEMFIKIQLGPEEEKCWQREFEFNVYKTSTL